MSINSRKNLRPFKPGQSGNPSGRPKGSLTKCDVEKVFQDFSNKDRAQLQAVIDNAKSTMLQIMIASVMIKAAKEGDSNRLQFLLDRAVGKVRDESYSEEHIFKQELRQMSDIELIELAKAEIPLLTEGKDE